MRPCDRFSPNGRASVRRKVVNVERIPGGPLTLELSNVPEAQALDVLLRSVSGYMAAPRGTAVANLSCSIASSSCRPAAAPRPAASAAPPAPAFQQPQFTPCGATAGR
jgi:hypothetical protein